MIALATMAARSESRQSIEPRSCPGSCPACVLQRASLAVAGAGNRLPDCGPHSKEPVIKTAIRAVVADTLCHPKPCFLKQIVRRGGIPHQTSQVPVQPVLVERYQVRQAVQIAPPEPGHMLGFSAQAVLPASNDCICHLRLIYGRGGGKDSSVDPSMASMSPHGPNLLDAVDRGHPHHYPSTASTGHRHITARAQTTEPPQKFGGMGLRG